MTFVLLPLGPELWVSVMLDTCNVCVSLIMDPFVLCVA